MDIEVIFKTARSVTIKLSGQGIFYTEGAYEIYINDRFLMESNRIVQSINGLKPDTEYRITVKKQSGAARGYQSTDQGGIVKPQAPGYITDEKENKESLDNVIVKTVNKGIHDADADNDNEVYGSVSLRTEPEFVTLDVKKFGAKGDGSSDDTAFIQAAILCCPPNGRVLLPKGVYKITNLFLKSDLRLEISEEAVLSAFTERGRFAVLPGMIESYDETSEYNLGSWEGNPLDIYAGIITGINVSNVIIYGGGRIEGNADFTNWWQDPRKKQAGYRPRLIFLNHSKDIILAGIRLSNSPSWTVHPYFSDRLRFIDLEIHNPKDSPNTDGINPESCCGVEIVGVYFSLGDDCIAVKSGKIHMGSRYKTPCRDILIHQCCMKNGHGAVTIGSEMSGGVHHLTAKDCLFLNTDRGLRIKTRRGRGKDAILDQIVFENIRMNHVMTPFAINSFYFCDPDGHTEYVRTKEKLQVDERTPVIKKLEFKDIVAENCHVAAFFIYGLPEQKIERVELSNIKIRYASEPRRGYPEMLEEIEAVCRLGLYANNIKELILSGVSIEGQEGEAYRIENVDHYEINGRIG